MFQFVNPYNFIPLGAEKAAADDERGRYTGVIEYILHTKTPLFIPNTSNADAFKVRTDSGDPEEHKSYDFFSYTDLSDPDRDYKDAYPMPVIPGSEIRGMLRSNYEILTNSCLSAFDGDAVLSKRTVEAFRPALIRKNGDGTYDLFEAKDYLWRTGGENDTEAELHWRDEYHTRKCYRQKDFPEGCKVYFNEHTTDTRNTHCKPLAKDVSVHEEDSILRRISGYIMKGEDGPKIEAADKAKGEKHCCHIFRLNDRRILQRDISFATLDAALREYRNNKEHEYAEYSRELDSFRESAGEGFFPVYYSNPIQEGHLMLSPACITREIYKNKLKDIVRDFSACTGSRDLCPACALFGMVGDGFQVSSRIRFSDLACKQEGNAGSCYDRIVTLPSLSTPKLGNTEFYLQKPKDEGALFWTYDYYIGPGGRPYPYTPQINGRKFYWHQMDARLPKGEKPTKLNMTIRPVSAGVTFSGRLYFRKLTKKELGQLLWLLNAGDEGPLKEKGHGYKLGSAKPLGLGSVALSVEQVRLRELVADQESRTVRMEERTLSDISGSSEGFDGEALENFRKMTSFRAAEGKHVSYPATRERRSGEEGENGYEWFVANHQLYNHRNQKPVRTSTQRNHMYFREYMEAMEPELKKNVGPGNPGSAEGPARKRRMSRR